MFFVLIFKNGICNCLEFSIGNFTKNILKEFIVESATGDIKIENPEKRII